MSPLFSTRPILLLSLLLITALVTSVIVLGLDADYVSKYANVYTEDSAWAFTLFASVWTLVTILPVLVLPYFASSSSLLQPRFLLANLGVTWVFWISAAASLTDEMDNYLRDGCGRYSQSYYGIAENCSKARALLAVAYITWLLVFFAFAGVLTLAIVENVKGNKHVWKMSVFQYPYGSIKSTSHVANPEMATSPTTAVRGRTSTVPPQNV